ncbi:MAG: TIR domain-containing protein [Bacteroidales bacterium]|nr:TIR domain-containing protein [Bacteroidales bacterium]
MNDYSKSLCLAWVYHFSVCAGRPRYLKAEKVKDIFHAFFFLSISAKPQNKKNRRKNMKNTEGYEYYAFISYKRENVQWAKWLHHKLEHYRLPANIRKNNKDLPNKIRPVFQDSQELSGGLLSKSIENSLRQSKYLIVICSPLSAKSPWVNREVQTFIDFGREENIIPFIIDGTPFSSTEEKECFPPALLNLKGARELLGISINEMGRDAAIVKVVARMFDLKFDTLWQRYEREKKRKRFIITSLVLAFALISLGIGSYIFRLNGNLEKSNKSLKRATLEAQKQRDRANEESKEKQLAYDSVLKQQGIIQKANEDLLLTNNQLREERDKVKKANWKMMENQSRVVAEQANKLIDEGDSYTARLLLLSILPKDLSNPDRPYTPEAEAALRRAIESETGKIKLDKNFAYSKIKIAPNNNIFALCNDSIIFVCNFITRQSKIIRVHDNYRIYDISFIDDKKLYVLENIYPNNKNISQTITEYDIKNDKIKKVLHLNNIHVLNIEYDIKNKIIIAGGKNIFGKLYFLDTENGKLLDSVNNTNVNAYIRNENYLIMGHKNGMVDLFNTSNNKTTKFQALDCAFGNIDLYKNKIIFCPNGIIYDNDSIKIFDIKGNLLKIIIRKNPIEAVFIDENTIAIRYKIDESITYVDIVDIISQKVLKKFNEDDYIESIALNYKKDYLLIKYRNYIKYYSISNLKSSQSNIEHDGFLLLDNRGRFVNLHLTEEDIKFSTMISYDGNSIIYKHVRKSGLNEFLEYNTVKQFENINLNPFKLNSEFVSKFGSTYLSSNNKGEIALWEQNNVLKIFKIHDKAIYSVVFSPTGKNILSTSLDGTMKVWEYSSFDNTIKLKLLHLIETKSLPYYANFTKDDKYIIASYLDNTIRIYNAKNYELLHIIADVWTNIIYNFQFYFSHDNKYFLTLDENIIKVWNIDKGICVKNIKCNQNINYAVFSDNNDNIIALSLDNTIIKIPFPSLQDIITEQRRRFEGRGLTDEEKRRYYLE